MKVLRADDFVRFLVLKNGRWVFEEPRLLMSEMPLSGLGAYRTRSVEIWSTGYLLGYGYCLSPYGAAYRSALRTSSSSLLLLA